MQTITIAGKPRTLRLSLGAIHRFREAPAAGRGVLEAVLDLLFQSLQKDNLDLTREIIADHLDSETIPDCLRAIENEIERLNQTLSQSRPIGTKLPTGSIH